MQLQDYLNNLRLLIHDTNSNDFTDTTLINFINQARTRVAMDTHCVRGFLSVTGGSALNTIPAQENYLYSGTVGGVTVVNGGTGYTNPSITFTNAVGDTGSGAAASAVVTNGVITAINMTSWGSGYGVAPTVNIIGGGGSNATATATALVNVLDILSITVLWGAERIMFKWAPFTMFQAFFRSITTPQGTPSIFTTHSGILQAFMSYVPDQAYPMEWDIITLPTPLTANAQVDTQVTSPCNDAVQLYAAHLCHASLGNYQMADYWFTGNPQKPGKYDSRIISLAATGFARRIPNPYRTYMKRLRRM